MGEIGWRGVEWAEAWGGGCEGSRVRGGGCDGREMGAEGGRRGGAGGEWTIDGVRGAEVGVASPLV